MHEAVELQPGVTKNHLDASLGKSPAACCHEKPPRSQVTGLTQPEAAPAKVRDETEPAESKLAVKVAINSHIEPLLAGFEPVLSGPDRGLKQHDEIP